jgi:pimeloyl-ACP methyl ester carboxylesterase
MRQARPVASQLLFGLLLSAALLSPRGGAHAADAAGALPKAGALLEPSAAVPATSIEAERMRVETRDGKVLIGDFYSPPAKKNAEERAPAALLLHGAGGNRTGFATLAEALARSGMAVLAIDLRGHGESATNEDSFQNLDEASRSNLWTFAVRDLQAAVQWLRDQPGVHGAALNLFGFAEGASLAAHYALADETVRSLTLLDPHSGAAFPSPVFDLAEDLRQLEGLPLKLVSQRTHKAQLDALLTALDEPAWIEVELLKPTEAGLLADKRLVKGWAQWSADRSAGRTPAAASTAPAQRNR